MQRKADPAVMKRELVEKLERVAHALQQVAASYTKTLARDASKRQPRSKPKRAGRR